MHIFFCAFLKNRQNKLHFSVSAYFSVSIVTHRKIIQLFCGFSYFSVVIFWNRQKNRNFSVRTKKNAQKNSSPTEQFEFPVVSLHNFTHARPRLILQRHYNLYCWTQIHCCLAKRGNNLCTRDVFQIYMTMIERHIIRLLRSAQPIWTIVVNETDQIFHTVLMTAPCCKRRSQACSVDDVRHGNAICRKETRVWISLPCAE